ncbi:hypothetical protein CDL15_Pgr022077 [Punica granatum]|uniref:Uncharacterized protein n=1 Tax=Punica granatum TaxID=22663 RepID=A0A218VTU5_PUNGR|nr:hypothetical protein CDL15_Pgr022077 [Punica granatum]
MGGGKMVLCVKRVKQELPEERDDTMPLPGDIIEGLACEEDDDLAGESFIPAQGRSEFTSQLGKIASQWKSEVIWVKMRRGENVVKIKARVVPEKGGMLQRKFTIQAATDDRHVAILRDLNLKECTELQGKSFQSTLKDFTMKVVNVDGEEFHRRGMKYNWKMKLGIAEVSIDIVPGPEETRFRMDIKRTEEGFICIYSVALGSAAERAGLGHLHEEANAKGHLLVISRLEGKNMMLSSMCSSGLINCCDHNNIRDVLTQAIKRMEGIRIHIMAWPNQARSASPRGMVSILQPPSGFAPPPSL